MKRADRQWRLVVFVGLCVLLVAILAPRPAEAEEVATFDELVAALNTASGGETITLTADIPETSVEATQKIYTGDDWPEKEMRAVAVISGTCTLDLGGHSVDVKLLNPTAYHGFIGVAQSGDLTLRNGTIRRSEEAGLGWVSINMGQLSASEVILKGPNALWTLAGSETTIHSGLFHGRGEGIRAEGNITVLGGTFEGYHSGLHFISYDSGAVGRLQGGIYSKGLWADNLKAIIPEYVRIQVDGVPYILGDDETDLSGQVVLSLNSYRLKVGENLEMTGVIGETVPAGTPLGVKVINVPAGKKVKGVWLNDTNITALKDDDDSYRFEMPGQDSTLKVTFEDEGEEEPMGQRLITIFRIDSKTIAINDRGNARSATMDVAPYINNSRTMLPVRFVGESLNMKVDFNEKTRDVTVTGAKRSITLNLDHDQATVDGKTYKLDSKPENVNGRTMLPIGEIADLIGLSRAPEPNPDGNLSWDGTNRTVTISVPV